MEKLRDLYSENDYKRILRTLIKTSGKVTLRKVAQRIRIQYTYLSRALNHEKAHLSEDHLYSICKLLEFFPEETDYIFLLRAHTVASDPALKQHLEEKLNRIRRARQINASVQEFSSRQLGLEMDYLFDPMGLVVLIALTIPEYLEQPRRLCLPLGLTPARLIQTLRRLRDVGFIELGEQPDRVTKLLKTNFHYGTDHPLMRVHQTLLRAQCGTQLAKVPEDQKHCMMTTFSADEATFQKVRERFQVFLKEVEQLVGTTKPRKTYQMNFELFQWM